MAVCDAEEMIASPLVVISDPKQLMQKLGKIIEEEQVEGIVLGLPLNMDGSEGRQAKAVINFGEQLKKKFDLPLHFQDERLSTFGAKEKLAAGEFTRKKTRKRLDAVAAAEILQAFLEQKERLATEGTENAEGKIKRQ